MAFDRLGIVKGFKYGFVTGLIGAVVGGVAVAGGWLASTGLTAPMFGGIGFAIGLAEGMLE